MTCCWPQFVPGFRKLIDIDQNEAERTSAIDRIRQLSPREREVLEGLTAGKPNKVIAFELNISPRTVEVYRAKLMRKMEVGSLSKLVRLMILATQEKP